MLNKKLMILTIFFVLLLFVSAVSAADNATDDAVGVGEINDEIASMSAGDVNDRAIASEDAGQTELSSNNEITGDNLQTSGENTALTQANDDETVSVESDSKTLGAGEGTYLDLIDEIGNGGDISLTKSYYSYTGGNTIQITTSGVINGNGAIIDMAGSNIRAFLVTASGVTIKNLTIKNATYEYDGGAISFYEDGTVVNCNFVNNSVTVGNGGAIYFLGNGTVVNCNFINNKALYNSSCGGAILFGEGSIGSVLNCNFTNNTAQEGGAIEGGSAVNCTFNSNSAYNRGGAMCFGSAVNCTFNYNSASWGGAMYGASCSAVNCSFVSNSATTGGSMYGGSAVNCSFVSNSAVYNGGAMEGGSAVNCYFVNNSASYGGGAMSSGSAVNCTFIGNRAEMYGNGGAVYYCSAVNCSFVSNSAYNGGAISGGSATDCIFKNNHARNAGGAMYSEGYMAANCQFINNTASREGGAAYNITASRCQFTNNNATEYGGAMYEGTANNCVFKDNKAGISGNNTYNTNVFYPVFSVSNFKSTYNSGDKLLFNLSIASGRSIRDATIGIKVYKNNVLVDNFYALSGDGWVVSIGAGSYVAVCSVENQAYGVDPVNATLTVSKDTTKLTASAVTTVYNGGKYLVATLKDSFGRPIKGVKVTIKLSNGKTSTPTTDKNGQVKFSTNDLAPKTYTATITFAGNGNYIKSTKSVKVTVKKANPKLTAKAKTFKKSDKTKKYSITLKTNQNKVMKNTKVTLKVNGKTYSARTNSKGVATFKLTKLTKKGKYTAVVKYTGSNYYNAKTVKPKITVK